MPGTIAGIVALAPLEHPVEGRHHVAAARLGRLVAALALGLEDRANLLIVADLRPRGCHRRCPAVFGFLGLSPWLCGFLPFLGRVLVIGGGRRDHAINRTARAPSPQFPFAMIFAISVCSSLEDLLGPRSSRPKRDAFDQLARSAARAVLF